MFYCYTGYGKLIDSETDYEVLQIFFLEFNVEFCTFLLL